MDKRDYELLLALDQHKNITKAAQSLYMTQPAITKRIQKMEEEQLHLIPDAAHDRTDIKPTTEMKKHDDDLMDNDEFWGK